MIKPVGLDYGLLTAIGLCWGSQFALNAVAIGSFPPLTIAAAVYSGHRYARELDEPDGGDVPYRRDRVTV